MDLTVPISLTYYSDVLCVWAYAAQERLDRQQRLLKIAARVIAWKTKVLVHLPNACPDQAILRLALDRLPRLVI